MCRVREKALKHEIVPSRVPGKSTANFSRSGKKKRIQVAPVFGRTDDFYVFCRFFCLSSTRLYKHFFYGGKNSTEKRCCGDSARNAGKKYKDKNPWKKVTRTIFCYIGSLSILMEVNVWNGKICGSVRTIKDVYKFYRKKRNYIKIRGRN